MIAAHCAIDPEFAPCDTCDCINGQARFPKWAIKNLLEETTSCPRRAITPLSHGWMRMFAHYKNGLLFKAGGIADQPHGYLQAMSIIDRTLSQEHADQSPSKV